MKTLILKVTVEGGSSQLGIFYSISRNGVLGKAIRKTNSFTRKFNLETGDYRLRIGGSNPDANAENIRTTIELIYDNDEINMGDNSSDNPSVHLEGYIHAIYCFKV